MTFEQFIRNIPHKFSDAEKALLNKALSFATKAHEGQTRKSGEEYITHPTQAALILAKIFPDPSALAATLLHDATEDTDLSLEEIKKEFGDHIAQLVDGVSKLGNVRLRNSKDTQYIETLRKMFIATSKDIRVLMVKLADRIQNMRTIEHLDPDKQKKIAAETLEMYAPIAGRLGIGSWKDELEDLSFKIVYPKEFEETNTALKEELAKREETIKAMQKKLATVLRIEGIKFEEVEGRIKRVYSLYKKLIKYGGDISKIYDIMALRIITRSVGDCYAALGAIHKHFQPIPGRIKDFIAMPKPNGYRSLHTTVFDHAGSAFEIQVRTDLMHEEADRGIAAHWFYTETGKQEKTGAMEAPWIKELHAWQESVTNPDEYLENLKIDFFHDRIFVLTPKGDVKDLPVGATAIDFAFAVHSDLGFYMMGAKINGKIASIYDELQQGDIVEILKSKKPIKISRDWLNSAKTSHARGNIRGYLNEYDKGIIQRVRELKLKDISLPKFFRKK